MNEFLTRVPLSITPLTPVHIGCGEDFEPTNYVIDDGLLWHFDPTRAALSPDDTRALLAEVRRPQGQEALLGIQRFFYNRRERFIGLAKRAVAVCPGVEHQYAERVGRLAQRESQGERINQLLIERSAFEALGGHPYLPASSLKGALRTAWLDGLQDGRPNAQKLKAQQIEKGLLESHDGFHTDPFRLVALADARGDSVQSEVVFATNHKKQPVTGRDGREMPAQGPAARREAIRGGQFRALQSELRLQGLPGIPASNRVPAERRRIADLQQLAAACNAYYLPRLRDTLALLGRRGFADAGWLRDFEGLLDSITPALTAGRALLLRVGRHSGAESVTLDGIRDIRIMQQRGKPARYSPDGATTVWLAAREIDARSGLLPFGWVLVEPAASRPAPGLAEWCERQPALDTAAIESRLTAARAEAREQTVRAQQARAEREAREAAEQAALAARETRLATASEQGKLILGFEETCEALLAAGRKEPFNPGSGAYGLANSLSRQALAEGSAWTADERAALAAAFERYLPQVLQGWEAKAARKKLQLAALRGGAG